MGGQSHPPRHSDMTDSRRPVLSSTSQIAPQPEAYGTRIGSREVRARGLRVGRRREFWEEKRIWEETMGERALLSTGRRTRGGVGASLAASEGTGLGWDGPGRAGPGWAVGGRALPRVTNVSSASPHAAEQEEGGSGANSV